MAGAKAIGSKEVQRQWQTASGRIIMAQRVLSIWPKSEPKDYTAPRNEDALNRLYAQYPGSDYLHQAAMHGDVRAIDLFVQAESSHECSSLKNKKGHTPFVAAILFGQSAAAHCLSEHWPLECESADLSEQSLGPEQAQLVVKGMAGLRELASLNISSNQIAEGGARHVAKALGVKSALTCLNVAGNFLDADATHHIASALATNSKLLSLNLSQNHIGPEGAKHLGGALQTNGTLSSLNIAGTALGTEGALHIGNALERCAQLLTLDISASSIDADGSIHIARALRNNRTIAKLIFSGDDVRGRSKPATMEVGMVALDVSGKYLMTSGANIFAAFLPRCRCVS
jgi:hypothetical protein